MNVFNKRRRFLLLCTMLVSVNAFSTNYYFSNTGGDDSRTSIQAQSPSSPWKSLSKLNSFFSSLRPGDSVLLKRGEQFSGSITIAASGTSSLPIVIAAYGSGAKPVITGMVTLNGWTSVGGGIWQSSSNTALSSTLNMVLVNGVVKAMGRYPNEDAASKGYLFYQSHFGTSSITSNQIAGIPNFTGGELVIRTNRFFTDRCVINSQSSTAINYTTQSGSTPTDGFGFFFQDNPATLDQFGEWYFDKTAKKLQIVLGNSSGYTVKASAIDTLIKSVSRSYITLYNLSLQGANTYGITVDKGSGFTIKNCDILYTGQNAVYVTNTSDFKIDGCLINYSHNRGIYFRSSNIAPIAITNNTIKNTGIFPGMGWKRAGDGGLVGIESSASGTLIQNNSVINTGFNGIMFFGNNMVVQNNYVDSFCFNKDDGGGIYTRNADNVTQTGRKVIGNIILNGLGAQVGTTSPNSAAQGIYYDDYTNGVETVGNTVGNCQKGIFLHDASDIIVRNNTLYNNDNAFATQFEPGSRQITNCSILKNIFFSRKTSQLTLWLFYTGTTTNAVTVIGIFDSNYYCRPLFEPNGIKSAGSTTGGLIKVSLPATTYYALDQWKIAYGKDAHSNKTATTVSDSSAIDFKYNATNMSKTISLSGSYVGVDGKAYSGSITLAPYSSLILLKSSTSSISNTATAKSTGLITGSSGNNSYKESLSIKKFTITATPNPSAFSFNLLIQSSSNEPIVIRVVDMSGKVLKTKTRIQANASFQLGDNLKPGMYIIEAIQGKETIQQKVVKE